MNITQKNQARRQRGFTLIEMIGVLAIIAVLAGMLVPRVFSAINDSRINSTVMSVNGVKSAAMLYFGKYGKFGGIAGATVPAPYSSAAATNWDQTILVAEGLLDKPFEAKVGVDASVQLRACGQLGDAVSVSNSSYDFDGTASSNEASGGAVVVECKITGLAADDAYAINKALDGFDFAGTSGADDTKGRVKYEAATGDLLIYVAHK